MLRRRLWRLASTFLYWSRTARSNSSTRTRGSLTAEGRWSEGTTRTLKERASSSASPWRRPNVRPACAIVTSLSSARRVIALRRCPRSLPAPAPRLPLERYPIARSGRNVGGPPLDQAGAARVTLVRRHGDEGAAGARWREFAAARACRGGRRATRRWRPSDRSWGRLWRSACAASSTVSSVGVSSLITLTYRLHRYGVALGCCARISASARLAGVRGRYSNVKVRQTMCSRTTGPPAVVMYPCGLST
jgi:hypothetical protein